jgi:hypothetical protein
LEAAQTRELGEPALLALEEAWSTIPLERTRKTMAPIDTRAPEESDLTR